MRDARVGFSGAARRFATRRRFAALGRVPSRLAPSVARGIPLAAVTLFAVVMAVVGTKAILAGGTVRLIGALGLCAAPLLGAMAWKRPLVLPYTLYLAVIPLENLFTLPGGGTITRLLGLLSAVPIMLAMVRRRDAVPLPRQMLIFGTFIVWMTLSLAWALDLEGGIAEVSSIAALTFVYLVIALYPTERRDLPIVLTAIVVGALIASVYGIWLFRHDSAASMDNRLAIIVGEDYIDPNHFANSLLLPATLLLTAAFRARTWLIKALFLALAIVPVSAIYLTLSREAFLALAAMLAYFVVRSRYRIQAISLLVAAVAYVTAQSAFLQRLSDASQSGGAGRLSIWKVGLASLHDHWFLGAGAGSFNVAYDQRYLDVFQSHSAGWSRASHNAFLHYGVELGIFGFFLYLMIWYGQFRMLRLVDRRSDLYDLRVAVEGALVALLVASFFIDLFNYKYTWIAFFLIAHLRAVAIGGEAGAIPEPDFSPPVNYFGREPRRVQAS